MVASNGGYGAVGTAPTVVACVPNNGTYAGGTVVVIQVDSSTGCTGATVGGVALTGFSIVDATHVQGTTGAHASGAVAVSVTNGFGTGTQAGGFTYTFNKTANALHLIEPGQYVAATPIWNATVGFSPNGSLTGAPPAASGNPDFSNNDLVGGAGDTISTMIPAGVCDRQGFVVVTPDTMLFGYNAAAPWGEVHLWSDHGYGAVGLTINDNGGSGYGATFWYYTGAVVYRCDLPGAFSLGTKNVIHWRYSFNGATGYIQVGVNGTWATAVSTADDLDPLVLSNRLKFGTSYSGTGDLDGRIHAHGIYSGIQTAAWLTEIISLYG